MRVDPAPTEAVVIHAAVACRPLLRNQAPKAVNRGLSAYLSRGFAFQSARRRRSTGASSLSPRQSSDAN
eukprot:6189632-Pleurochrysis_carterae.AAC.2